MKSDWVSYDDFKSILGRLPPADSLAMEVSLRYGLRISDVLAIKSADVRRGSWTLTEQKTGKKRRVRFCKSLQLRLLNQAGTVYVFESRCRVDRHRSRQAVYKNVRRVASELGIDGVISPHSARKSYAVERYKRYGLNGVQRLLNHDRNTTTMIYALSDVLKEKKE